MPQWNNHKEVEEERDPFSSNFRILIMILSKRPILKRINLIFRHSRDQIANAVRNSIALNTQTRIYVGKNILTVPGYLTISIHICKISGEIGECNSSRECCKALILRIKQILRELIKSGTRIHLSRKR